MVCRQQSSTLVPHLGRRLRMQEFFPNSGEISTHLGSEVEAGSLWCWRVTLVLPLDEAVSGRLLNSSKTIEGPCFRAGHDSSRSTSLMGYLSLVSSVAKISGGGPLITGVAKGIGGARMVDPHSGHSGSRDSPSARCGPTGLRRMGRTARFSSSVVDRPGRWSHRSESQWEETQVTPAAVAAMSRHRVDRDLWKTANSPGLSKELSGRLWRE